MESEHFSAQTGSRLACESLAEGWTVTPLKDVVLDIQPGFACGVHNATGEGVAHLRPMNVNEKGEIALSVIKYVPASEVNKPERLICQGDVLFNNTNSPELVGKTAFYDCVETRAFSNHMTRVRCNSEVIDGKYCASALHQLWRIGFFQSACNNHVSQSSISRSVLKDTIIPLPPLPEQRRIVARLEALLAEIERVRGRLEAVAATMQRFRQAVLAAACDGRLTER